MFFKVNSNGYILGVGIGSSGEEITQEEYNTLTNIFHNIPVRGGYVYKLKIDLTWEEHEVYPEPENIMNDTEALSIILGGAL